MSAAWRYSIGATGANTEKNGTGVISAPLSGSGVFCKCEWLSLRPSESARGQAPRLSDRPPARPAVHRKATFGGVGARYSETVPVSSRLVPLDHAKLRQAPRKKTRHALTSPERAMLATRASGSPWSGVGRADESLFSNFARSTTLQEGRF